MRPCERRIDREPEVDVIADEQTQAGTCADIGEAAGALIRAQHWIGVGAALEAPGVESERADQEPVFTRLTQLLIQGPVGMQYRARVILVPMQGNPFGELSLKVGARADPQADQHGRLERKMTRAKTLGSI